MSFRRGAEAKRGHAPLKVVPEALGASLMRDGVRQLRHAGVLTDAVVRPTPALRADREFHECGVASICTAEHARPQPPAQVAAEALVVPVERPVRWGIVGTGYMARRVGSDLQLLPDAELAAICTRSPANAARMLEDLTVPPHRARPAPTVSAQLDEILTRVDILYVATPHPLHFEPALAALERGVAVLVEKPITINHADASRLVEAAREHGAFLMEAMWMRFSPVHVKLRELVRQGVLGEIRRVVADLSFRPPAEDWTRRLFDPAMGGGCLLDLGPYPTSLIQSLLGHPLAVDVHGSLAPTGVDDDVTLLLRYPQGAVAVATCSLRVDGPCNAAVFGSSGSRIEVASSLFNPPSMTLYGHEEPPQVFTAQIEGLGYVPQLREVHDRLRAGDNESAVMPHEDTLSTMRIIGGALEALGVRYPSRQHGS